MTPFQLEESAKAPWTKTIVGLSAAKAEPARPSAATSADLMRAWRMGVSFWNGKNGRGKYVDRHPVALETGPGHPSFQGIYASRRFHACLHSRPCLFSHGDLPQVAAGRGLWVHPSLALGSDS